jgi:soluble lytic murein transglycosylase-like protein
MLKRALLTLLLVVALGSPGADAQERPLDQHALFRAVAVLYNLDPGLLEAIATVESHGDAAAVSPAGAQGLMQLMPDTARRFRVTNPFDPVDNALGAARFLDHLRRWQQGRPDWSAGLPEFLAAYNAGEGAVDKHHGVPPYPETKQYVRRVLQQYLNSSSPRQAPVGTRSGPISRRLTNAEADRRVLDQLGRLRQARADAARAASTGASAQQAR